MWAGSCGTQDQERRDKAWRLEFVREREKNNREENKD